MQKLIETLSSFGIEIPADKQTEVKTALSKYYKNIGEYNQLVSKLENDRDRWKDQAETAAETLKSFEGIDPEKIQSEIADWKKKAEDAEKDAQAKIYERDFADALKSEMEGYKFTSEAAKKSIMGEIKAAGLKLKDGKILGLSDLIEQIKAKDASAFVDEHQEQLEAEKARFTQPRKPGATVTGKHKLAAMTLDERMKLKATDPNYYEKLRKGD